MQRPKTTALLLKMLFFM